MLVPPGETVVEEKSCKSCGVSFVVTDRDLEFYDKVSPVFAGRKESIPTPTLCPDCRQRRRLAFRNERKLYRRKCDLTGKDIVSVYSPDKPYKVYGQSVWWGDWWDAMDYGREFDFSRTFAEQFDALFRAVPRYNLYNFDTENCEYVQYMPHSKDCYLVFGGWYNEESYYGGTLIKCTRVIDGLYAVEAQECYENTDTENCYEAHFAQNSKNCRESLFLYDCIDCSFCIGCAGLRNKKYHVLNREVSPEEFETQKRQILESSSTLRSFSERFRQEIASSAVRRFVNGENNESSTGDYLYGCKNVHEGFLIWESEDIAYSTRDAQSKSCYDISGCGYSELTLDTATCDYSHSVRYSLDSEHCSNIMYSNVCDHSSHLFACIGLRHKQYCILNKQYTEAEYNELVPRIIEHMRQTGEWWEFFSPSLSPFGYNETVAMEYFPLSKEQALKQGFNWSDYEPPFPKVDKVIPASKLPENIKDIPDDILNWAIECEITKKPYRIIKQELDFYRKHSLPIPRRHPDQRHLDRLALRNPRKLHERTCDSCPKSIVTTYAPDRPERVYCEECYEREVYG